MKADRLNTSPPHPSSKPRIESGAGSSSLKGRRLLSFSSGFTLVELLIGLVLLGLVMTMIFSGLYTSSRSWEAGDKQARDNDNQRLILAFIRRQINQTVPIFHIDDNDNRVLFRGERNSLYFVARLPAHRGGTDLYLAALQTTRDQAGGNSLVFRYEPLHSETEFLEFGDAVKTENLIDNLNTVELSYFGSEKPDEDPRCRRNWEYEDRLPQLIRLKLESDNEDAWPEMLMRVPARLERGQPQMVLTRTEPQ